MAGITFGNRVTTVTQDSYLPKLVDHVLNSNRLFTRFVGKAKRWSGENMKFPIKIAKNTLGASFSGYDTFSTAAVDTRRTLLYRPSFYEIPVSLPLDEVSVNATEAKVLDLIRIEMSSTAQDGADDLGTQFYGTGAGTNFLGLEELVEDGTNDTTNGGLTRASFTPALNSTVTAAASSTLTLAQMDTLFSAVRSGGVEPTAYFTTETVADLYRQLLTPQERIMKTNDEMQNGMRGGTGFTSLAHMGKPVIVDEKATSGVLYLLNEDFMDFYAQPLQMTEPVKFKNEDIQGNEYSSVMGLGFSWSGWIKPINSASIVGHIYFGGQLVQRNPKRSGKLTSVTSV
jgi:hypothetical protein